MKHAYLDTMVYNDIERNGPTASEETVAAFRAARRRRDVVAHLSLANLEELLGVWETDRPTAIRRLRLAHDLVGLDRLVKQPRDLMADEIQAYVVGASPPSPFLPGRDHQVLKRLLDKIVSRNRQFDGKMLQFLDQVKKQKEAFRATMGHGRDEALRQLRQKYQPRVLRQVSFEDFWVRGAAQWAEAFAKPLGFADACRKRGFEGLLAIRAVRLVVGVTISLIYSQVVDDRQPALGDKYDLSHVCLASAADVFVTGDAKLAGHLARIPGVEGFRVVKSLGELLAL